MSVVSLRLLQHSDIEFGLSVGARAGWNQLESDWQRTVNYAPQGCFLANYDGQPAGTVTTTAYGSALAWIGMMLVDPRFRRLGVATRLMQASIEHLRQAGVTCIKLDATAEGREVYTRLGFQDELRFQRWERVAAGRDDEGPAARRATSSGPCDSKEFEADRQARLDLSAFGVNRLRWLTGLAADSVVASCSEGYGMRRPGRLATYLGPIVADDRLVAAQIVENLLSSVAGRIFWDVPGDNPAACELANDLGFKPVREFTRMWFGRPLVVPQPAKMFALADPSTG